MKKILVILGGGRLRGNTRQLVDAFARGATDAGHEVEIVPLNKVQVNGCLGCNACRYGKPCIQKDGFNELAPKIKAADCVVFASPLLFWTISSKLKAFVERFYCIAEEDPNPPLGRYEKYPVKDSALLMTSADNRVELGSDARGNLVRIENALDKMPERLRSVQEQLENLYNQQAAAKAEVGKPFPQEQELAAKTARLIELDMELNLDGKGQPQPEQAIAKSARPSVLDRLKAPPVHGAPEKPHKKEMEAR